MQERTLSENYIHSFSKYLTREEKSPATCEKYLRDVRAFLLFSAGAAVTKDLVVAYKKTCMEHCQKIERLGLIV